MGRRINGKAAAAVLAPLAASIVGIGMSSGVAHAEDAKGGTQPLTFVDSGGATVHCAIDYGFHFEMRAVPGFFQVWTQVSGDPGCAVSDASAVTNYKFRDSGNPTSASMFSERGDVSGEWYNVKDARIDTYHDVTFRGCNSALSQCDWSFHLSHGK